MRKLWLLFSQIVTACVALLFVVQTFKPQWLQTEPRAEVVREVVKTASSSAPLFESAVAGATPTSVVSYAQSVKTALPSVVSISSNQRARPLRGSDPWSRLFLGEAPSSQQLLSLGSGVIVSEAGHILTNNHVIEGADDIQVTLESGKRLPAKVVGIDSDTDLAVLKIQDAVLPVISFGNEKQLRVGDVVLAIGNPYGVGQTVTQGIVSALGRNHLGINTFENFIQTDAAINPGNSGGALVNTNGQLIGINTLIFSGGESGGSVGIGFAIPISMAQQVLDEIIQNGHVARGYFGVELQDIAPGLGKAIGVKKGVVVLGVLVNGPAAKAGVQPGDVITAVDDLAIHSTDDFTQVIAGRKPEDNIQVSLIRNGQSMTLAAVLKQKPNKK